MWWIKLESHLGSSWQSPPISVSINNQKLMINISRSVAVKPQLVLGGKLRSRPSNMPQSQHLGLSEIESVSPSQDTILEQQLPQKGEYRN